MDELGALLDRQIALVATMPFDPSEWTCTEQELLDWEQSFGQELAKDHIEYCQRFASRKKRVKELRWACEWVTGFPGPSLHALPILIAAIREIEQ